MLSRFIIGSTCTQVGITSMRLWSSLSREHRHGGSSHLEHLESRKQMKAESLAPHPQSQCCCWQAWPWNGSVKKLVPPASTLKWGVQGFSSSSCCGLQGDCFTGLCSYLVVLWLHAIPICVEQCSGPWLVRDTPSWVHAWLLLCACMWHTFTDDTE